MVKVVIPSALIVPKEQQNIGKLPAIIYPADDKIMLDFFLEQYGNVADSYEISLYEESERVKDVVCEYDEKINLYELDELKDIGYSIYYALSQMELNKEDSIIINYADVIVLDYFAEEVEDTVFYTEERPSSNWAYFSDCEGVITDILYNPEDLSLVKSSKIFVGVFAIKYAQEFKKILGCELSKTNESLDSFFRSLMIYNNNHLFEVKKTVNWFDIGHTDKYYEARIEVKSRAFNYISIDKDRGVLTKKSDSKDKFIGEIMWYLKLPSDVTYSRPRIFSYSTDYMNPYITMEYYPYHTLHELMLYGNLNEDKWGNIFEKIRFVMNDYGRYTVDGEGVKSAIRDMYINKTISRIEELRGNSIYDVFWKKEPIINGKRTVNLEKLIEIIPMLVNEYLLDVERLSIIHGDLCFSNIMVDPNYSFIKLIDPRGKFGKYDIYGDSRYEIAKLLHSCEGKYDYIIKDMFTLEENNSMIDYHIKEKQKSCNITDCLINVFSDYFRDINESKRIRLIEALLFISMAALHTETKTRPIVMLCRGLEILCDFDFL